MSAALRRPGLVWLVLAGVALGAALGAACARGPAPRSKSDGLRVVCTTFPVFLFTRNIAAGREGVTVELMLPAAMGCPHDYVLTPQDMQKIARADLLVANGLGLEEFLGEPITSANPGVRVVEASRGVGEVIWTADGHGGRGDEKAPNPHIFSSPRLAARMIRTIAAALSEADSAGASVYARNAERYAPAVEALASECASAAAGFRSRKIVTVHAVFDYFARDCGLEIAAVVEETPGQEPAAARMLEIVRVIRRSGAAALFTEPQYPAGVGRTIAREAGIPEAMLDPVASGPDDAPLDYYERTMRANLATLARTLR